MKRQPIPAMALSSRGARLCGPAPKRKWGMTSVAGL
jgi:hypothetical protein